MDGFNKQHQLKQVHVYLIELTVTGATEKKHQETATFTGSCKNQLRIKINNLCEKMRFTWAMKLRVGRYSLIHLTCNHHWHYHLLFLRKN